MSTTTPAQTGEPVHGGDTPPTGGVAKVSLAALIALVIGSMIGGGIFSLPSQMGSAAAPGPLIIGWIITGVGMLMLAMVFQRLSMSRPSIDAGVYGYAREGLGNYLGFASAWGYWLSAWMGNVGYLVLLMAAIGTFIPAFGDGNTPLAIGVASVLLWVYHFLILRGIREAAAVNAIVTVAKVVPIVVFIVIAIFAFKADIFLDDFWGANAGLGGSLDQVKNMMLVTVWVFIGVEGASVFSERAKKRNDVGTATIIGFVSVLAMLLAINMLSYGIVPRAELAELKDPSLGGVLTAAVGPWGAKFIAGGLAISLIGALMSWFLMCAEVLRVPAKDHVLPQWMATENKNGVPVGAMWLTSGAVQLVLLASLAFGGTYTTLILLASALILLPYLFSTLYQLKVAAEDAGKLSTAKTVAGFVIGGIATIYAIWLVYAAGLTYLLWVGIFYLVGTPFYIAARRKAGKKIFGPIDVVVLAIFVLLTILIIIRMATGGDLGI